MVDANRIALIGVPSSAGARQLGQEQAPRCLRLAGLTEGLQSKGLDVLDLGDLPEVSFSPDPRNPRRQNLELVRRVLEQVAGAVESASASGAWPLVVGGDCTVTIGVLAGLTRRLERVGLMYFDGDIDLNTPATTLSGIFDGMVLAHILGEGADEVSRLGPRFPLVEERLVALFGYSVRAGGIDPAEVDRLRASQMARYPLEEIQGGVGVAATRALRDLERRVDHFLVHFDVDVVDFDDFPAADVPHKPGISLLEAQEALRVFVQSPKAAGLVVTEFNGRRDTDESLAPRLNEALQNALARRR